MSFLAPAGLFLLACSVPIILLWMFRQRREPLEVPTNFLWRRAAEEERVSPVIRKLLRSLLLFLQLLAILLLALAGAPAACFTASTRARKRSESRLVITPTRPSATRLPSTRTIGRTSPVVPVKKSSSA